MRSDKSYNNIFEETKTTCTEINVSIPEVKYSQYLLKDTIEEMKITVYNSVLDKMINGIKTRFSQGTLNLIDSAGNLLKLKIEKKYTKFCRYI